MVSSLWDATDSGTGFHERKRQMMDDFTFENSQQYLDKADACREAGDTEGMKAALKEGMEHARQAGAVMPVSQLEAVAAYIQQSVEVAIQEIVMTARAMGAEAVPVSFLEYVAQQPCSGAQNLWKVVEDLDVPMDWGVPEDLSELGEV
jgi:hypothetical protein